MWLQKIGPKALSKPQTTSTPNSNSIDMAVSRKPEHKTPNPTNSTSSPPACWLALVAAAVKLLLFPAYRSTDFEVHRHWLALTHSLPLSHWYSDESSPWTLDYPPFFAHFELFLSHFARLVDPTIVHLHRGLDFSSPSLTFFHRLTVVASETLLFYALHRLTRNLTPTKRFMISVLVLSAPGLVIVDHVHFQYNGFLLGILMLSLSCLEDGRDLMGGFVFAVLLCFKHLFAVAAPVYFVYLLRHYCRGGLGRGLGRLVLMGTVVVAVLTAAYGPFVYYGQIQQVLRRMFPFGRGLCHAYWAPNFWVFYILLDKGLAFVFVKLGFSIQVPTASFTGGLVGDSSPFAVLPRVTPLTTFVLILLALFPCLIKTWRDPKPSMVTRWVAYAYTCGFFFGWHVHEKASLHFVIPLAIVALQSVEDAKHYFLLSIVSSYSLFPLLFEAQEYPIKVLLLLLHSTLMWFGFSSQFSQTQSAKAKAPQHKKGDNVDLKEASSIATQKGEFAVGWLGKTYLFGVLAVETWTHLLHPIFLGNRLPFLPLMMISVYCAFGMMYSLIWQLTRIVRS